MGVLRLRRRLNRYICHVCGNSILTEDKGVGVTPFQLPCACGETMFSQFYRTPDSDQALAADLEWYTPETAQLALLTPGMTEHAAQGGLVFRVISNRPAAKHFRSLEARQWRSPRGVPS